MRHGLHTHIPATEATAPTSPSDAPFYPEDLRPAGQDTLAALANVEPFKKLRLFIATFLH